MSSTEPIKVTINYQRFRHSFYALRREIYLMDFPTNAGDSVIRVNVPQPINGHAMSLGQIKQRNWPSYCSAATRFYMFMHLYTCVESTFRAWNSDEIGRVAGDGMIHVVHQQWGDRCQRWLKTGVNGKTTKCFRWWRRRFKYSTDTNLDDMSRDSLKRDLIVQLILRTQKTWKRTFENFRCTEWQ